MSIKHIYDEIVSFGALYKAMHDINAGHQFDYDVLKFRENLEGNLLKISGDLYAGIYPPDRYHTFYVYEPKLRKIICSDYTTKLIQRSMYNALNPLVTKTFIEDTTSCIEGRGNLYAAQKLLEWINYAYDSGVQTLVYKMDVHKFFYCIDHGILMGLWERKLTDRRTLDLIDHYTCHASMPFGLPEGASDPLKVPDNKMSWKRGITIGGGLSHLEGNLYLDPLDRLAKQDIGIHRYIRHADDIIFLGTDKSEMNEQFFRIQEFLNDKLKLEFNNKTALRRIEDGVEFVGYRIAPHSMKLRKQTALRMKRHLRATEEAYRDRRITFEEANETMQAYLAMLDQCDSDALKESILNSFTLTHNSREEEAHGTWPEST